MNTYEVTLVKVETTYKTTKVTVQAENDDDARVLAKYETVYSYEWQRDSGRDVEQQHIEAVHLVEDIAAGEPA